MKRCKYIGNETKSSKLICPWTFPLLPKWLLLLFILYTLPEFDIRAQATIGDPTVISVFAYDEIPVRVMVEGLRIFYIDAIYGNNKILYVNVEDLLGTLNINCVSDQKGTSLEGFIENENRTYTIDFDAKQIRIGSKIINTKNGLVKDAGAIYMESSLFSQAFGISLTFNYRALTIILKSDFELPVLKQQRIEKQHTNMAKFKGEIVADTIIKRDYHLMKLGMVDWSLGSYQASNGSADHHFGFGIGTELLYGEADVAVNYYSQYKFDNRQLFYLWRWVDNDQTIIKQAQVGKISNQSISFLDAPIIGAVIRNSPTTIRKATGYYTINEFTEPNWNVELYINNVMVDFTKADASGSYQFKVPIVYGYTTLKLKFYGPLGEERTEERTMNVPYTVMPAGEFEYGLSGGILQDTISSRFGRAEFNYGVNRLLTIGGGIEYLSSIPNNPYIPFATATLQPFSKLTINAEYDNSVKTRFLVNYYIKKDLLLEIDYAKFVEGQRATLFNAPEERKIRLSAPFRYRKMTGFARLDFTQLVYKAFNYNLGNLMLSAYFQQFSASSSTQVNWIGNLSSYVINDFALSYRIKNGITIRPSAQYNFSDGRLITCKLALEKYIPRGNFAISYEKNVLYNDHYINVSFRYDLSFARTNLSVSHSRGNLMTSESAQGSLAFGGGNGFVYGSNNSSVSKGGIILYPFLDLNHNGIFDPGERMVKIASVSIMGGKVIFSKKDSIVRIPDLNAFTSYLVEFHDNDLENIAWRFKKKVYQVLIDPNQFKRINIPVESVGEVNGMAYLNKGNNLKGIKRILVKFYEKNSNKVVAETLSESDGYIDYMGLEPGEYVARIDPDQLTKLEMVSSPETIPIQIAQSYDGTIVSGLDFTLSPAKEMAIDNVKNVTMIDTISDVTPQPDTLEIAPSEPTPDKLSVIEYTGKVLQIGAYRIKSYALIAQKKAMNRTDQPVILIYEHGLYKTCITGLSGAKEIGKLISKLSKDGYPKAYFRDLLSKESREKKIDNQPYSAVIQVAAFKNKDNAVRAEQNILKAFDHPATMTVQNEFYIIQIWGFTNRNEAYDFVPKLIEMGFQGAYIVRVKQN